MVDFTDIPSSNSEIIFSISAAHAVSFLSPGTSFMTQCLTLDHPGKPCSNGSKNIPVTPSLAMITNVR